SQELCGFGRAIVDQGDTDAAGSLHGSVGNFEELILDGSPQVFRLLQCLTVILADQQDGKGIITQTCQDIGFIELFAQEVGNVAQDQVRAGDPGIGLDPGEVVQGNVEQGSLQFIGQGFLGTGVQALGEILSIVQPGEQILAADFLELLF